MASPTFRIKRSAVSGRIPTPDQVPLGEIAFNTYDGKLFASKNVGIGTTVITINPWDVGIGTNTYNTYFTSGNVGINSLNPTSKLDIVGDVKVSGVVTASSFSGNASTASTLQTARTISLGSDLSGSASFDGSQNITINATIQPNSVALGDDTTGNYVATISGTANEVEVSGSGSENASVTVGLPNNVTISNDLTILRDVQVNRNLNVNGNITIGGTTVQLNTQELLISDPDIVLGIGTSFSPTDSSASHGGIAIASTEGTPLVNLNFAGETNPSTYKKIMWFKGSSIGAGITDAWLINYAVGIGSTQVPHNVRLSVGGIHVTDNDIRNVRNAQFTGISTFGGNVYFGDNDVLNFGDDNDLRIYHDGVDSYIRDFGTGNLNIYADNEISIRNGPGSEYKARFITDGAVELYYDAVKKFETTSSGIKVQPSSSSSGIVEIQTGTINSDSIRFQAGGTVNTYLEYRGYLGHAWFVDTTEVVRFNSTGVGIGITNPSQKLTVSNNILLGTSVSGGTATPSYIDLGNNNSNGATRDKLKIYLYNSGNEQYGFSVGSIGDVQYHSNAYHDFYIANNSAVRINSNRNLLVGSQTDTNTASQPLQVTGGAYVSGNIGIGATNPLAKLDVRGSHLVSDRNLENNLIISPSNHSNGVDIECFNNANTTKKAITLNAYGGNVLIGSATATGTSSQPLQVTGGAYVSGNLGVGVTNPGAKLQVRGSDTIISALVTNGNYGSISITSEEGSDLQFGYARNSSNYGAQTTAGDFSIKTTSTRLHFPVGAGNANSVMVLTSSGNVLIGSATATGTASQPLQVTGGAYVSGNLGVGIANPYSKSHIVVTSSSTALLLNNTAGGGGAYVDLDFSTYSAYQVGYANAPATIRVIDDGAYSGHISFRTKGASIGASQTEQVRIQSDGNVGINTTNPSQKLHVQGSARITGALYDSNNLAGTTGYILQSTGIGVSWTPPTAGVDAGTLDGLDSAQFLRSDANDEATGVIDFLGGTTTTPAVRIRSGGNDWSEGLAIHPASDNGYALTFFRTRASLTDHTNTWALGNFGEGGTNNFGLLRRQLTGGAGIRVDSVFDVTQAGVFRFGFTPTVGSNTIWHAGNDGAGSGLDADTLDGIQASSFLQSESDTLATVTARGATTSTAVTLSSLSNHYSGHLYYDAYDINGNHYPHFVDGSNGSGTKIYWRLFNGATNTITHYWGTDSTSFSNSLRSTVDVRAPIFYDSDDTNYYVNPATGTNLNGTLINNGGTAMTSGWNRNLLLQSTYPVIVFNSYNTKYSGIGVDFSSPAAGFLFWVNGSSTDISGTGTVAMSINTGNYVTAYGSFRAPIFYDSDDTNYYVNPAGTSILSSIDLRSTSKIQTAGFAGFEYYNTVGGNWEGFIGTENNTGNLRYNSRLGTHTFYSNSSAIVTFNSTGVGIGVTNPTNLLTVNNTGQVADYVAGYFGSNATAGESRTWITIQKGNLGGNYGGAIGGYLIQGIGGGLIFGTQNSTAIPVEKARIDTSGNLLINSTSATGTSSQPLQVTGGAYVSGNLGVGEVAPTSKLTVRSDSAGGRGGEISIVNYAASTVGNEAALNFGLENSTYNADNGNAQIKARVNNVNGAADLIFSLWSGSSFNERVRIQSDGNFGINTTNPQAKLSVGSGSINDSNLPVQINAPTGGIAYYGANNNGGYGALFGYDRNGYSGGVVRVIGATDNIDFVVNNTTRAVTINPSGSVGIGITNPSYALHVRTSSSAVVATLESTNSGGDNVQLRFKGTNGEKWAIGNNVTTGGTGTNFDIFDLVSGAGRLRVDSTGNVGINTTNPSYKLHVVGSFAATTKSFVIDHPTKEGMKLRHGSLEGPENGVYVRGRLQSSIIKLPDYWVGLVHEDSITVNLTPIGDSATPRVRKVSNNQIEVFSKEEGELDYYYTVFAERKDVEKLEVEI